MMPACDRHPSADAKWVIFVKAGLLYFCQHCRNKHRKHVIEMGYRIAQAQPLGIEDTEAW